MIGSSPKQSPWSATKIVQVTLGLWSGSIHQPAMVRNSQPSLFILADIRAQAIVYALYDLCQHPQYIEALREEMTRCEENKTGDPFEEMVLLDSFLKESARFSPSDSRELPKLRLAKLPFENPSIDTVSVSLRRNNNRPLYLHGWSLGKS